MKSMTGYGAGEARAGTADITVVVKSVNGRFLETRFHLPREFFPFETQLKKQLAQIFRRGTVDVFVYRRGRSTAKVHVNRPAAESWLGAYQELLKSLRLSTDKSVLAERLLALPQVFEVRESLGATGPEKKALFKAFQSALNKCQAERLREGASLRKVLLQRIKALSKLVSEMARHREEVNAELETRIKDRLRKLGFEGVVEPTRLAQEIVLNLDKVDISEELERLKEHMLSCERYMDEPNEQGKRLDFYSQELLREVNTVGSKANHAVITEKVVQAKGLIESFKEQVQNIE